MSPNNKLICSSSFSFCIIIFQAIFKIIKVVLVSSDPAGNTFQVFEKLLANN